MHATTWPQGKYHDRLIRADGAVSDVGWRNNIVVDRCRQLLAAFMKSDGAASGVEVLAIGRGDAAWDGGVPAPAAGTQQLTDTTPVFLPVAAVNMSYLGAAGEPVTGPTNRLQIVVTLDPGTPPPPTGATSYPLREFALFGDFGGERYMIDYVRHPVIHKSAGDTLVRTIRLLF